MNSTFVSICMAAYNAELYIRYALDSICNQTYTNFECIIVDDHSTDSTVNIIMEYCKRDSRFKLYTNCTDPSKPYVDAHNVSYSLAKGKYLIRFDDDDIMHPNHIETIVKEMDSHPEYDAVCTTIEYFVYDAETDMYYPYYYSEESYISADEFNKFPGPSLCQNKIVWFNQTSAIRKDSLNLFHLYFETFVLGDFIFWLNAISMGCKLYRISDITLSHRQRNDSTFYSHEYTNFNDYDSLILMFSYYESIYRAYPLDMVYRDNTIEYYIIDARNYIEYFKNKKKYKWSRISRINKRMQMIL
jgi:glycosyltransferase EpsE